MNGLSSLWGKLSRSKSYREAFVGSNLKRGIPAQIRAMLKQRGWTQSELATRSGLTQGAVSRASDPDYGNLTFNNALKLASGFDVAFVGKFVPFSQLATWYDEMSEETLMVPGFEDDGLSYGDFTGITLPGFIPRIHHETRTDAPQYQNVPISIDRSIFKTQGARTTLADPKYTEREAA